MIRFFVRAAFAATTLAALAGPAFAHVTFETGTAEIGKGYKAVLRIPHGCGSEATNLVRVQIPEGFHSVKPMPKAGWTLETVTGAYAHTYVNHGSEITEGVKEIVWSGGELPDAWYDEFVFRGTFDGGLEPGTIAFPTTQECATGVEAWTGEADRPAPSVELTAAASDDHHGGQQHQAAAATVAGDIEITGAFTRATLPNAPVAGGFLTLTNKGSEDDRLIAVTTPIAKEGQIHEMAMEGDVMKMRQLPDGLVIPAGETVVLQPGGFHLMFMGLNGSIAEGDAVPVTLTFEKAGTVTIELIAGAAAADGPANTHAGH